MREIIYTDDKNVRYVVQNDEWAISPREDSNLGHLVVFSNKYNLSDEDVEKEFNVKDYTDMDNLLKSNFSENDVVIKVGLYDHGNIRLYSGMKHGWDYSNNGFMYITEKEIKKEFEVSEVTPELRENILDIFEAEISHYTEYLNGEVYEVTQEVKLPYLGYVPIVELSNIYSNPYKEDLFLKDMEGIFGNNKTVYKDNQNIFDDIIDTYISNKVEELENKIEEIPNSKEKSKIINDFKNQKLLEKEEILAFINKNANLMKLPKIKTKSKETDLEK